MNILHIGKLIHLMLPKLWLLKKHQFIAMIVIIIMEVSSIIMKIQRETFMHIFQKKTLNTGTIGVEATNINLILEKLNLLVKLILCLRMEVQ